MTLQLGVLISGRGTNLQAILDAVGSGSLDARVRLVLSNRADAAGLERAAAAGVATEVVSHRGYADRASFDRALVDRLRQADVEWVVLAGFMRILTATFLEAFPNRVVNIHPSLLPSFPGVDAQAQAIVYGVKLSGCTVHLVNEGVDAGPILAQRAVPVQPDDDEASLSARILEHEHELLVSSLRAIAAGQLTLEPARDGKRARAWLQGP